MATYASAAHGKAEDVDVLWSHYRWMQELGVKWFNIALDDISEGIDASGQAKVANEFLKRLRAGDADAQLIVCPTWYWGDGTDARYRPYLETFARELGVSPATVREIAALTPGRYLHIGGDEALTRPGNAGAGACLNGWG